MNSNYTFEDQDDFARKPIAENIVKLLNPNIDISPIVIDGSWGTGKTIFSLKLFNLLKQGGSCKVVYMDAFKEDHSDSPILSLTAAIASIIPSEQQNTFIQKALPALRFGLKTTVKAAASWILKQDGGELADDFKNAIEEVSNASIDATVETLLKEHIDSEKNIKALKNALETISNDNKIIVIIDELDRCKPSFAVSILENIKHIFDAKNVYFILITNMDQLRASVSHSYGSSLDAERYLDKFIKYTITLPNSFINNSNDRTLASVEHWRNIKNRKTVIQPANSELEELIEDLIKRTDLSLRETETFIRNLEIYQALTDNSLNTENKGVREYAKIVSIFLYCFAKDHKMYQSNKTKKLDIIAKTLNVVSIPWDIQNEWEVPMLDLIFFCFYKELGAGTNKFPKPSPISTYAIEKFHNQMTARYHDFSCERVRQNLFFKMSMQ